MDRRGKLFGADITAPVVWESSLKTESGHVELNDIIFRLGNDNARGALEITFQDGMPVTTGSLAFESLDLNQIVSAFFPDNKASADLSFLDRFGLDLRLSTSRAIIHGISMSNLAASIQIRNSRLVFDIGNAQIFGGTAQINIQLRDNRQSLTELEGRLSASNLNLDLLQQALGRKSVLSANANLILTLQSSFPRWTDFLPNARGNLSFDFGSSTLANFNMDDFMQHIMAAATFPLATAADTFFRFDKMEGKAALENGQINLDFVTLRFGEQNIDIYVSIDWLEKRLKLTGTLNRPRAVDEMCFNTQCIDQSLLPIPQFAIDGFWQKPTVFLIVR